MNIDKSKVKRSFSKSANIYDEHSELQKETARKLIDMTCPHLKSLKNVVDIGSGTGTCSYILKNKFPDSNIFALDIANGMSKILLEKSSKKNVKIYPLNADAEYLPFLSNSIDLAVSNLSYQWTDNLRSAFLEVKRVLKKGSIFSFSTFSKNTFKELKESHSMVIEKGDYLPPLHKFKDLKDIENDVSKSDLKIINCEQITIKKEYVNTLVFLKSLKGIGAKNASKENSKKGLYTRKSIQNLAKNYEANFSFASGIYATYEIVYITVST